MNIKKLAIIATLLSISHSAYAYDAETEIAISNAQIEAQSYYNYLTTLDRMAQESVDSKKRKEAYIHLNTHERCVKNAIKENYSDCMKRRAEE